MSVSSYLKRKKAKANLAKAKRAAKRLDRETRKKFKFSGKVEKSFKGTPEQTKYFVKGKTVATVQHGAEPTAQVSKQADIKFQRQGESVAIRRAGITTTNIEAARIAQRERAGTFSGKVERSFKGTPEQTKYFVEGRETGRVTQTPEGPVARVTTPSQLKFKKETVKLGRKEVTVEQQQVMEAPVEPVYDPFGSKRKKELSKETKEYENVVSGWKRDEEGKFIAPSESDYKLAQKEYKDIKKVEAKYPLTEYETQYYFLPTKPSKQTFTYGVPGVIEGMTFERAAPYASKDVQEMIRGKQTAAVTYVEQAVDKSWQIKLLKKVRFEDVTPEKVTYGVPGVTPLMDISLKYSGKQTFYPGEFLAGVEKEIFTYPIKYPAKSVVLFGVGVAAPFVFSAVGKSLGTGIPAIKIAGAVSVPALSTAQVGATLGLGAVSYYGYSKSQQFQEAPDWESKGRVVGGAAAEIGLLSLGSYVGKFGYSVYRTRGRTYAPKEDLVPEDVLSGKHRFPLQKGKTPSAAEQLKLFKYQSQRLPEQIDATFYHATGEQFWKSGKTFEVGTGASEFQGLYGSYGVSPNFLRIPSGSIKPGKISNWLEMFNVFQPVTSSILQVKPTRFETKGYVKVAKGKYVFTGKTELGVAYIPGKKLEVESIFIPETQITPTSGLYYTKWGGIRVPIDTGVIVGGVSTATVVPPSTIVSGSSYSAFTSSLPTSSVGFVPLISKVTPSTESPSYSSVVSSVSIPVSSYTPSSSSVSSYIPSSSYTSSGKSSTSISVPPYVPPYSPPPSQPIVSPPVYSPPTYSPPYSPPPVSYYKQKPITSLYKLPKITQPKRTFGRIPVFGRRFGKFKVVGYGRTPSKAFKIGTKWASQTLGASFKIPKARARKLIGFRTKVTKKAVLYIEPREKRLKKRGRSKEVPEIELFKKKKKRRRKKK